MMCLYPERSSEHILSQRARCCRIAALVFNSVERRIDYERAVTHAE